MTTRRSNRVEEFSICLLYDRVDQGDVCPKRGKAIFHNDHNQSSTPLSWFHYLKVLPYPQSESSLRYQDFNGMTLQGRGTIHIQPMLKSHPHLSVLYMNCVPLQHVGFFPPLFRYQKHILKDLTFPVGSQSITRS